MATRRTSSASVSSTSPSLPPHRAGPNASNRAEWPVIPGTDEQFAAESSEGGSVGRRGTDQEHDGEEAYEGPEHGVHELLVAHRVAHQGEDAPHERRQRQRHEHP